MLIPGVHARPEEELTRRQRFSKRFGTDEISDTRAGFSFYLWAFMRESPMSGHLL
jgi:hypothetical protein